MRRIRNSFDLEWTQKASLKTEVAALKTINLNSPLMLTDKDCFIHDIGP